MAGRMLGDLEHGEKGRVVKIRGRADFHRRLVGIGLGVGTTVEVTRADALGGRVDVKVNGCCLPLLSEEAARIWVESM